jgi:hypothetical protein
MSYIKNTGKVDSPWSYLQTVPSKRIITPGCMFLGPSGAEPSVVVSSPPVSSGKDSSPTRSATSSSPPVSSVVSFLDLMSTLPKRASARLQFDGLFVTGFVTFSKVWKIHAKRVEKM